ncbi:MULTISPECIES: alpha/beta fold hydrolase [unclassified Bradyrhizobium]|uniref:alpha/beta fold hydrolase n=1 Tax=unclassified Bradyrhizobium TaxID=2631580 RepID=UPI001BAA753C|nr:MULTISPECIES: alpha/beta fold hydrolase [unclassified Bradyrhizobium]MBR1206451.1 alpha/beta fold hydrolase [Bradyrhizobium sp. AUGA SZCCT0124]MBR1315571.1 alpha/beta fold hydrolase [Bradyrhizobium sp. AUGA SZCCT0051]MBR1338367.1 alpha/beta fold hydrolase [Bradyrhizobium sp. AUGA SZCCT0105]MBR1356022.1 alpha/beta fold hydrolase [Bradyrhizobium sp. AUGA SZCCT0045]
MSGDRHFTTGDGCRIAYRIDGPDDRPVLALSNSIATDLHMWNRSLPALSRSFRLLRYDTRGHGGSDAPVGAYSMDRLGRDVVELLDALGIDRAHFLGLSLGGFIGQWLGIFAPERIDRLILSNTASCLASELPFDDQIRAVLAASDMDAIADGFMRNWFPATMLAAPNAIVDEFRGMVLTTPPRGLAGCYAALRDVDLRRVISLITAPTLVIGGDSDTVTRANHSGAIAATIPDAKLVLLPGVHILNVEQADRFNDVVANFLGSAP